MVLPEPVSGGIFLNLLRTLPEPTLCQVELVRCFLKWKLPETFPDTEMIKKVPEPVCAITITRFSCLNWLLKTESKILLPILLPEILKLSLQS